MQQHTSFKEWFISLDDDRLTLEDALASLATVGAGAKEIPFIIRLLENPCMARFRFKRLPGAVTLANHDAIHILLGRGLLPKDEAFTIGFTMGNTKEMRWIDEWLFSQISRLFYPKPYQFSRKDIDVFRAGVHLGRLSQCQRLDKINFKNYLTKSLSQLRTLLGLEVDLLKAYYRIEQQRFPECKESQRLVLKDLS